MKKSIIAAAVFALTSTTAIAADYSEPAPEPFSWTGFYIGAFAAYNDFSRDLELSDPTGPTSFDFENSLSGFSGGGLLGFNYQFDSIVVGVEGDIGFASIEDSELFILLGGANLDEEIDMTYGVRARLGYAIDHTLLFVTGGVAWADYEASAQPLIVAAPSVDVFDETLFGWQIGAGVEQAVTDNITVRLEYLYTDYESEEGGLDFNGDGVDDADTEVDLDSHTIRLGVNFLFNAF